MGILKNIYNELATNLSAIDGVKWVDLWNSQVYNLDGEHPFPAPAIFLAFRTRSIEDVGVKVQALNAQVDVFLFYETFLDTFHGAYNKNEALAYLDMIDAINTLLHGSSGTYYKSMRRTGFSPVDTGGAGNLYSITYDCLIVDDSAQTKYGEGTFKDLEIDPTDEPNGYIISG
jgi:hypothetical protein